MTTLYHGTAWHFEQFADDPTFFTTDFDVAVAYARDKHVPAEHYRGMYVLTVDVDVSNYLEYPHPQVDAFDWEALVNELLNPSNVRYDGLIMRNSLDYCGVFDGIRQERRYDQYLVRHPDWLKILERALL